MKVLNDIDLTYVPYFLIALGLGIALEILQRTISYLTKDRIKKLENLGLLVVSFLFLGLTLGFLTGGSREPVVQSLLPIIPTIFGTIAVYVFYNDKYNNPYNRKVALLSLLLIMSGIIFGAEVSAVYRMQTENDNKQLEEYYKETFERFKTDLKTYEWEKQKELGIKPN